MKSHQRAKESIIQVQNMAHMHAILGTITQHPTIRGVIYWCAPLRAAMVRIIHGQLCSV